MKMWNLPEASMELLQALPESGMGFQLVEGQVLGIRKPLLVLNSEQALDLSSVKLEEGDDPTIILRNGMRIVHALNEEMTGTMFGAPAPNNFRLLSTRIPNASGSGGAAGGPLIHAAPLSSLVKKMKLKKARAFHRFSAFNPDRRVDSLTGNFLPGTYACPESEVPFVPTGFVAVGRFALPNILAASHHYEIEAPPGTDVEFGTVAPAFGQSGGGVEAYFQFAVVNQYVPPKPASQLADE